MGDIEFLANRREKKIDEDFNLLIERYQEALLLFADYTEFITGAASGDRIEYLRHQAYFAVIDKTIEIAKKGIHELGPELPSDLVLWCIHDLNKCINHMRKHVGEKAATPDNSNVIEISRERSPEA